MTLQEHQTPGIPDKNVAALNDRLETNAFSDGESTAWSMGQQEFRRTGVAPMLWETKR
jgi:hypothetical protein